MKLTDHFGNSEILEVGEIDVDYDVVDITLSNDTDPPIRIQLGKESLIELVSKIEELIDQI